MAAMAHIGKEIQIDPALFIMMINYDYHGCSNRQNQKLQSTLTPLPTLPCFRTAKRRISSSWALTCEALQCDTWDQSLWVINNQWTMKSLCSPFLQIIKLWMLGNQKFQTDSHRRHNGMTSKMACCPEGGYDWSNRPAKITYIVICMILCMCIYIYYIVCTRWGPRTIA